MSALQHMIGDGEVAAGGDPIGNGGTGHARADSGLDPINRIFHHEAASRIEFKLVGSFKIEVRSRLDAGGVPSADGEREPVPEANFLQPAIHPAV